MIEKIISGGQTGVDQAALDKAIEIGIEIGGFCPRGGIDENGSLVLEKYPALKESETAIPDERTRLNIENSDATLIIVPCWPLPDAIKDGTRLTIEYSNKQKKPNLIICADNEDAILEITDWIEKQDIKILNIGGPRESSWPGIYLVSADLFRQLFTAFRKTPGIGV